MKRQIVTYMGESSNAIEDLLADLMERGGEVIAFSIAYGPSPAKVAGQAGAPDGTWHGMVIYDWPDKGES